MDAMNVDTCRLPRATAWTLASLALVLAVPASVRAQPVQVDVVAAGFSSAGGGGGRVFRFGQWTPIVVQVTTPGTEPLAIRLRCEAVDRDGDRIAFQSPAVVANPGVVRRAWFYAAFSPADMSRLPVLDVLDERGALITTATLPPIEPISNDAYLILDISARRLAALDLLRDDPMVINEPGHAGRRFLRPVVVARLPATDLPDKWFGLEAVDAVVWDQPDPGALEPAQLAALIDWVRNGGHLIVGLGDTGRLVGKTALGEILPVECGGPAVAVSRLPALYARFGVGREYSFASPLPLAPGRTRPDAVVLLRDRLPDNRPVDLLVQRQVGSGLVTSVAVPLGGLKRLSWLRGRDPFARQLFELTPIDEEFTEREAEASWTLGTRRLAGAALAAIDFRRAAGLRSLAAFGFVAAYILLATLGTWTWLRSHRLTHLNWVVFASFALVAAALSLGVVRLSRGFGSEVHVAAVVDLPGSVDEARMTAWVGYRSSQRELVDLAWPGTGSFIRPLSGGFDIRTGRYSTPSRYAAWPADGTLQRVLVRATLKQFEGCWRGPWRDDAGNPLRVTARLVVDRATGMLRPESWIRNELGAPIEHGVVLLIDPRLRELDGVPQRAAGLTWRNDRPQQENKYLGREVVPAAVNVLAVPVPRIEPNQRVDRLYQDEYARYLRNHQRWAKAARPDPEKEPMLPTLCSYQLGPWSGTLWAPGATTGSEAALLLASTRNLLLNGRSPTAFDQPAAAITTEGLLNVDITHWLTRGQAVLLLVVRRPPPVELTVNGQAGAVAATDGVTLYRVRVPVEYVGRSPTRKSE